MIISHYSEVDWDGARWSNFSAPEVACPCCGEMYYNEDDYDAIQLLRTTVGVGVILNSAHRCILHNAKVGGARLSEHKKNAFDISLSNQEPVKLYEAAQSAGFTGFGFYGTFLHVDRGRARQWFSKSGEKLWTSYLAQ